MTVFCGAGKLDPKISPHGIHTVYDSVCGAGNCMIALRREKGSP